MSAQISDDVVTSQCATLSGLFRQAETLSASKTKVLTRRDPSRDTSTALSHSTESRNPDASTIPMMADSRYVRGIGEPLSVSSMF